MTTRQSLAILILRNQQTESPKMNVVDVKWIPVVNKKDQKEYVNIKDIFENDYKTFGGDPVENYSLLRFLIVLAQSNVKNQPTCISEWRELRNTFSENVLEYLSEKHNLFELTGEAPFLQDISLKNSELFELILREKFAYGNNAVTYTNQIKKEYSVNDVILDLIVLQMFSVNLSLFRSCPPSRSLVYKTSPNGNLNFYGELDTIKDTIWYNMSYGVEFGYPVWESGFDQNKTNEFLNKQFPLTYRILFNENITKMASGKGLDYVENVNNNSFFSMTKETFKAEKVDRPMPCKESFKFFEGFDILLSTQNQPNCLKQERTKLVSNLNIISIGFVLSSNSGFFSTKEMKFDSYEVKNPEKTSNTSYIKFYRDCVTTTNDTKNELDKLLYIVFKILRNNKNKNFLKGDDKSFKENYVNKHIRQYYSEVEKKVNYLFSCDGTDEDKSFWTKTLSNIVESILSEIVLKYGELAHQHISEHKHFTINKRKNENG